MTCRFSVWIPVLVATLFASLPECAKASPPDSVRAGKELTFRGYPAPETQMYFLLRTGMIYMLDAEDEPARLTIDVGLMKNLGPSWALGGNLRAEVGDEEGGIGALVRGRRWLSRSVSVDLATGFLSPTDEYPTNGGNETSWITQADVNVANLVTITAQADRWRYSYGNGDVTGTNWYLGGSIQYLPGVIALVGLVGLLAASW